MLIGCSNSTEKVMKSADINYKYVRAMDWYNKGAYFKAIPVFEELMGLYKGAKTTEEVYYYYCMAHYKQGSYILASYHFKNYVQKHPQSKYAEECLFMHAESYYMQSPKVYLDQTETKNAINAYQVFINSYPSSARVTESNNKIDELRNKLEEKALRAAELYFKTKNYRAAAVSYKNLTLDFPGIQGEKEIQYKIVKSYFEYAQQSIVSRQSERFEETIKEANSFLTRYGTTEFAPLVRNVLEESHLKAIESSLDYATILIPESRISQLEEAEEKYNFHFPALNIEKYKEGANFTLERINFEHVKANFELAQASGADKRIDLYKKTVLAYNNFITNHNNSKFAREANKYYSVSLKNIKKSTNG